MWLTSWEGVRVLQERDECYFDRFWSSDGEEQIDFRKVRGQMDELDGLLWG